MRKFYGKRSVELLLKRIFLKSTKRIKSVEMECGDEKSTSFTEVTLPLTSSNDENMMELGNDEENGVTSSSAIMHPSDKSVDTRTQNNMMFRQEGPSQYIERQDIRMQNNFSNVQGPIHLSMPAGASKGQDETLTTLKTAVEAIDQKVECLGSEMNTVGVKINALEEQSEKQLNDVAQKLNILDSQISKLKDGQVMGKHQICELIETQIKVSEETTDQLNRMKLKQEAKEDQRGTKLNTDIDELHKGMASLKDYLKERTSSCQETEEIMKHQQQILKTIDKNQEILQALYAQVGNIQANQNPGSGTNKRHVPLKPELEKSLGILKSNMRRVDEVITFLYSQFALKEHDFRELKETKSHKKVQRLVEMLNLEDIGFITLCDALEATDQSFLAMNLRELSEEK